jgi:hypothetical protein
MVMKILLLSLIFLAATTATAGELVKLDRKKTVFTAKDFSHKIKVKEDFPLIDYKKPFVPMDFPNGERIGVGFKDDDTEGHAAVICLFVGGEVFRYARGGIDGVAVEVKLSKAELVKSSNEIHLTFDTNYEHGTAEVVIKDRVPGSMTFLYDGFDGKKNQMIITPHPSQIMREKPRAKK